MLTFEPKDRPAAQDCIDSKLLLIMLVCDASNLFQTMDPEQEQKYSSSKMASGDEPPRRAFSGIPFTRKKKLATKRSARPLEEQGEQSSPPTPPPPPPPTVPSPHVTTPETTQPFYPPYPYPGPTQGLPPTPHYPYPPYPYPPPPYYTPTGYPYQAGPSTMFMTDSDSEDTEDDE